MAQNAPKTAPGGSGQVLLFSALNWSWAGLGGSWAPRPSKSRFLDPTWPNLAQLGPNLDPTWFQLGPNLVST